MERDPRTVKTLTASVPLFLSLLFCSAGMATVAGPVAVPATPVEKIKIVHRSADEVYKDKKTGLEFPCQLGAYLKTRVSENVNPVIGTLILYQNEADFAADVCIYSLDTKGSPVTDDAFQLEVNRVVESIMNLPKRSRSIERVACGTVSRIMPEKVAYHTFQIRAGGEDVTSCLMMFLCKGKIIKCRVSYPAGDPEETQAANDFFTAILKIARIHTGSAQ